MAPGRFAIRLTQPDHTAPGALAKQLADYLNEFDESCMGEWAGYDEASVREITAQGGLAFPAPCSSALAAPLRNGEREDLFSQALLRLGNVVIEAPQCAPCPPANPRVFNVGQFSESAPLNRECRNFHLTLNPLRFSSRSVIHIIADTALEWAQQGHDPESRIAPFVAH